MLGGITDDLAELAALANVCYYFGHHLLGVQEDTVRFRAVHNTEATAFFRHAFLIGYDRDIVHAPSFPPLMPQRPSTRSAFSPPTPPLSHRLSSPLPGSWRAAIPS